MSGFDYSKWDKIELSDDEDDLHPNIDKESWFRMKHRDRVEREEDEGQKRQRLERRLVVVQEELRQLGEAAKEHVKAKKLQKESDDISMELTEMDKQRKWNADNMCKMTESKTLVDGGSGPLLQPEPRLQGEAVAKGYCEFVEEYEDLLEEYISLGPEELEVVQEFLKRHGGTLLQGEHAESYLLLDCLEKEMNDEHDQMLLSARQQQLLTQLREFSRAAGRPVRDGVVPMFQRLLDHQSTRQAFDESVASFVARIVKRAPEKKKEMDAEADTVEEEGASREPGQLDPTEVFRTLPEEMKAAFREKDLARLQAAVESLPPDEAKRHLQRCEESGLWVPNPTAGPPPYRG